PNPQPKRERSDWLFRTNLDRSKLHQKFECKCYRLYLFECVHLKVALHNLDFQNDEIEASLKKCIQVESLNKVNCYEQNCLSYCYYFLTPTEFKTLSEL